MQLLSSTFILSAFAALSAAEIHLDLVTTDLAVGDAYTVRWSADSSYVSSILASSTLLLQGKIQNADADDHPPQTQTELLLVQQEDYGWKSLKQFFSGREVEAGNDSVDVTIPNVVAGK